MKKSSKESRAFLINRIKKRNTLERGKKNNNNSRERGQPRPVYKRVSALEFWYTEDDNLLSFSFSNISRHFVIIF